MEEQYYDKRIIQQNFKAMLIKFPEDIPRAFIISNRTDPKTQFIYIYDKYIDNNAPYKITIDDELKYALVEMYRRIKHKQTKRDSVAFAPAATVYQDTNNDTVQVTNGAISGSEGSDESPHQTELGNSVFDMINTMTNTLNFMMAKLQISFKKFTQTQEFRGWIRYLTAQQAKTLKRNHQERSVIDPMGVQMRSWVWQCDNCTHINRRLYIESQFKNPPFHCRVCGQPREKRKSKKMADSDFFSTPTRQKGLSIILMEEEKKAQNEELESPVISQWNFINDNFNNDMDDCGLEINTCAPIQRLKYVMKNYNIYLEQEKEIEENNNTETLHLNNAAKIESMYDFVSSLPTYSISELLDDYYHATDEQRHDVTRLIEDFREQIGKCNEDNCVALKRCNRLTSRDDRSRYRLGRRTRTRQRAQRRMKSTETSNINKNTENDDKKSAESADLKKQASQDVVEVKNLETGDIHMDGFTVVYDPNASPMVSPMASVKQKSLASDVEINFSDDAGSDIGSDEDLLDELWEEENEQALAVEITTIQFLDSMHCFIFHGIGHQPTNQQPSSFHKLPSTNLSTTTLNMPPSTYSTSDISNGDEGKYDTSSDEEEEKHLTTNRQISSTVQSMSSWRKLYGNRISITSRMSKYESDATKHESNKEMPQLYNYKFGVLIDYRINKPSFKSLKQELMNNSVYKISEISWHQTLIKAITFSRLKWVRSMVPASKDGQGELYGVVHYIDNKKSFGNDSRAKTKQKCSIGIDHLVAILFYCNFDQLQAKFSETFWPMKDGEKHEEVVKRHCENFYWFGRSLFVAINFFGSAMNSDTYVYHGLSHKMLFKDFSYYFAHPTSTTTEQSVAHTFSGHGGIILKLKSKYKRQQAFMLDVSKFSDFRDESERLFLNEALIISDIINAGLDHAAEYNTAYKKYMKALNFFNKITTGNAMDTTWNIGKINEKTWDLLTFMIDNYLYNKDKNNLELYDKIMSSSQKSIPLYVEQLFRHYCHSKELPRFEGIDRIEMNRSLELQFYNDSAVNINHDDIEQQTDLQKGFTERLDPGIVENLETILSDKKIEKLFPNAKKFATEKGAIKFINGGFVLSEKEVKSVKIAREQTLLQHGKLEELNPYERLGMFYSD